MAVELYDDHEQGERVRRWLQSNGISIVLAVVLALGGVFGFQQYQANQLNNQSAAANYFNTIQQLIDGDQLEMAEDYYERLQSVDQGGFYVLASIAMATGYVEAGRLARAASLYQTLWNEGDMASFKGLIGLRLARLLNGQGDHEAALDVVSGAAPIGYEGAWAEARGDIYYDLGDMDQARAAYQQALDSPDDMGFGSSLLQMKFDATGPGQLASEAP